MSLPASRFAYEIVCACNECDPEPASSQEWERLAEEWRLWDITLAFGDAPGPPPADVERIREVGGLVLHEFNVPRVRAVLRMRDLAVPGSGL